MLGIAIILLISQGILKVAGNKIPDVLGIRPTKIRLKVFLSGLLLATMICCFYHILSVAFVANKWVLDLQLTFGKVMKGLWWVFKSVLFEELIFRGVLLYFAIRKWGSIKATFLSAVGFGIYHWFSYSVFGQPVQMLIVFLMTGLFGFALAFSFAKTRSLYLPLALHLGWNIVNIILFSAGPIGPQVLVRLNTNRPEGLTSLFIFLFQILTLPLVSIWFSNYLARKVANI